MDTVNLKTTIEDLIKSKREGDYWDFKAEPHTNNAALLHDIISLSNSLHKGERFLILGVSDSKKKTEIIGLNLTQNNRKKQSNFIDFLRNVKFAGSIRPEIELYTLKINEKEIDVLVIFDNPYKPYYLIEDFKCQGKVVKANYIYTRVNDTNTPIDKSADINVIEKMWRQRFGLDLSPMDKLKLLLLEPQKWEKDLQNKKYAYHNFNPEFHIEFLEPEKFGRPEAFCLFYPNDAAYSGIAKFQYHTTTLFELKYMFCDEMRIILPVPSFGNIKIGEKCYIYFYYNLSTLSGRFLHFLTDGSFNFNSRGKGAPFICYKNEKQKCYFENYIAKNRNLINNESSSFLLDNFSGIDEKTLEIAQFTAKIYQIFHRIKSNIS